MPASFLAGTNPVLARELRASLRNARAFALLAVYVAVLGAIVVSQFPSNTQLAIGNTSQEGQDLFRTFVITQAFLVVVLFPALASGTLAQERERRTLEPLLLSPLTPLQIVWGKAAGVLSLSALLLVSTLPLTSLAFLLGGVSPGELIAAYSVLMGLALFTTGIGLYCSARWPNTTQATVACYVLLPMLLGLAAIFSPIGSLSAGLLLVGLLLYGIVAAWRRWSILRIPKKLGILWWAVMWLVLGVVTFGLLTLLAYSRSFGWIFIGIFCMTSYFVIISQWSLLYAAQEISRRVEPAGALRQRLHDWKEEWGRSTEGTQQVVYLPPPEQRRPPITPGPFAENLTASTTLVTASSNPAGNTTAGANPFGSTSVPSAPRTNASTRRAEQPTYGIEPFLSDKLNPVLAKDLRTGLLGRFEYLFRFSYGMTVATEILLLLLVIAAPATSVNGEYEMFLLWAKLHLGLLMVGAAWLGARSIAPEREQQTLPQLFTTPLLPATIVKGKIMAVMIYSGYILVMGIPLVILLAALDIIPWMAVLIFLLVELVLGVCAASWGLLCSLQCLTVRRATGTALGGMLGLLLGAPLLLGIALPALRLLPAIEPWILEWTQAAIDTVLPMRALERALHAVAGQIGLMTNPNVAATDAGAWISLIATLLLYSLAAAVLLFWTARSFKNYAQNI